MAKETKKKEIVDAKPPATPEYIDLTGHDVVDVRPASVANLPVIDGEVGVVVFGKDDARKKMVADVIHRQLKNIGMPVVERHEFHDIGKSHGIDPESEDSVLFMINQRNPRLFGTRVVVAVDNIGQCLMSPDQRNIVEHVKEISEDVRSIADFVESTDTLIRERLPKTKGIEQPIVDAIVGTAVQFGNIKARALKALDSGVSPDAIILQLLKNAHGDAPFPRADVMFVQDAVRAAENEMRSRASPAMDRYNLERVEEFNKLKLRAFVMLEGDVDPDVAAIQILTSRHGNKPFPPEDVKFVGDAVDQAVDELERRRDQEIEQAFNGDTPKNSKNYVTIERLNNVANGEPDRSLGGIVVNTSYAEQPDYNKLHRMMQDMDEAVDGNSNVNNALTDLKVLADTLPLGVTIRAPRGATITNDEDDGPSAKIRLGTGETVQYVEEKPTYSCYSTSDDHSSASDCRTKDSDSAYTYPGPHNLVFAAIDDIVVQKAPVDWKLGELYRCAEALQDGTKVERRGAVIKNDDNGPYAEYKVDDVTYARF